MPFEKVTNSLDLSEKQRALLDHLLAVDKATPLTGFQAATKSSLHKRGLVCKMVTREPDAQRPKGYRELTVYALTDSGKELAQHNRRWRSWSRSHASRRR